MLLYAIIPAAKLCNLRVTQVIGFKGSWRAPESCQCAAWLEFSKKTQVQWWALVVLEMLEPCDSHQKLQSKWNGGRLGSRSQAIYILLRVGSKRWSKPFRKTQKIVNKSQILSTELFGMLELDFALCRLWLYPVFSLWNKKHGTLFFDISGAHRLFKRNNYLTVSCLGIIKLMMVFGSQYKQVGTYHRVKDLSQNTTQGGM